MLKCRSVMKDAITTVEAGQILERDPSAIRHMIRKGKIVAEKRGRDNYVSRKDVLKILIQRETKNGKKK